MPKTGISKTERPAVPARSTDTLRHPETSYNLTITGMTTPYARTEPDLSAIRSLYNGTDARRPLGSFMAAPVIDLLASFIGMPRLVSDADGAEAAIATASQAIADNTDRILDLHRAALRDGSAWLLITYRRPADEPYMQSDAGRLALEVLPRDTVRAERDFASGQLTSAEIVRSVQVRDGDFDRAIPVIQTITPRQISYRLPREAQSPPRSFRLPPASPNPWGFVPLVQFVNEPGAADGGLSEIERIEPYMQLYHDVLWAASQGSRMHSTPKLCFSLEDPADFIRTNFGQAALDHPGGEIRVSGTEAFFLGQPDRNKAYYLEADNPIGSAVDLLRLLFYCMIIASGTPEYALGVHMSSSYASTKEQAPIWALKVQRKQYIFGAAWATAARMMLAVLSKARATRLPPCPIRIEWDAPDVRDRSETARQRLETVQSVVAATEAQLMSDRTAMETLRALFPDMKPYSSGTGGNGSDTGGEAEDAQADADRRSMAMQVAAALKQTFRESENAEPWKSSGGASS